LSQFALLVWEKSIICSSDLIPRGYFPSSSSEAEEIGNLQIPRYVRVEIIAHCTPDL
jgi:hypothetical protein